MQIQVSLIEDLLLTLQLFYLISSYLLSTYIIGHFISLSYGGDLQQQSNMENTRAVVSAENFWSSCCSEFSRLPSG